MTRTYLKKTGVFAGEEKFAEPARPWGLVPNLQIGNALVCETLFREPLPANWAFETQLTPLAVFACHGLRIGDSKTPAFPIRDWERARENGVYRDKTLARLSHCACAFAALVIACLCFLETPLYAENPRFDFDEIVFVERIHYQSNHYYTDFINGGFFPMGNLCVLNVRTGATREIVHELKGGVFGRFDLSFDAKKVVFAWKKSADEGYRIYECGIDARAPR